MLRYDAALDFEFDAALMTRGPLRWLARDRSKPGRSGAEAWLLHASADWSEANLEQSAEFVAARLLAAFADLGARAPQAWLAHRWRYANAEPALNAECGWDAGSAIGLCGDWLNGGNVEGAWLSGCRLAGKIAAAHGVTADLTAKP
jgi:predicted NAD/FAD-dependent oxidoreductase